MINNFKWAGSVCTYLLCVVFVMKFFFQASHYPPQHACFCHLSQQGPVCVWIWLNIIMLLVLLFEFHPLQFFMCMKCVYIQGVLVFSKCFISINYNNFKKCAPLLILETAETVVLGFTLSLIILWSCKLYFAFGCASHVLNNDLRTEENVFLCHLVKKIGTKNIHHK